MKRILITILFTISLIILKAGNPPSFKRSGFFGDYSLFSSQISDLNKNYIYPEWGFYIDAAPGYSFIENNPLPDFVWKYQGGIGYTFNMGYFKSITPYFKVKSGIGVSNYRETLDAYGEIPPRQMSDIDNDLYIENLTLNNVHNTASNTYITVPLLFELGNTSINKIGYYVNIGASYSYLFNENYKPSGTYTTTGTYEKWGVTLENVDELGFYSEKQLESNAHFKKNNISVIVGAGITIPISSVLIFKAGLVGNYGLNDIGNNRPAKSKNSPLPDEVYNYRANFTDNSLAILEGSKNRQIGFEVGLYICRRVK